MSIVSPKYEKVVSALQRTFVGLMPLYIPPAHGNVGTKVMTKARPDQGDTEPVVDLDNHSLDALRRTVLDIFDADLTIGEEDKKSLEEMGRILAVQNRGVWTVDGLDGTYSFIRGTNSFGGMVSRRVNGHIDFMVGFRPIDWQLYGTGFFVAERGKGAWEWCRNHNTFHKLQTAAPGKFDEHTNPRGLERFTVLLEGGSKNFAKDPVRRLVETETTRPSLSSVVASTTIARGTRESRGGASALVAKGNKAWDNWPAILIIQEAGGIVTDFQGNPVKTEDCGDIIAAANQEANEKLVKILSAV